MIRELLLASSLLVLLPSAAFASLCPGGLVKCPDFMTCCQLANKKYGCCPFPTAVCCNDHVHCCPQNMQCDVVHQACLKHGFPTQFMWQVPVQPQFVEQVEAAPANEDLHIVESTSHLNEGIREHNECADGHTCPSTFTCCKMYSGKYGCCPFDGAQCCQDGFHCCPQGTNCNTTTWECQSKTQDISVTPHKIQAAEMLEDAVSDEGSQLEVSDPGGICPDGKPCPEKFTCCRIIGSRYGCCPYSEARCCTDGIHCCPKGTNCNTTTGTCDIQTNMKLSVPAYSLLTRKLSDKSKSEVLPTFIDGISDVVCPDVEYHCPDGNTCCQLGSGAYGCCPLDRATCCPDKEHCCPYGYQCFGDSCIKSYEHDAANSLTSGEKLSSPTKNGVTNSSIEGDLHQDCPDKTSFCPDGNTCCQLPDGAYGCCPLPQATCCADKVHCCPHAYHCVQDGCEKDQAVDSVPLTSLKPTHEGDDLKESVGVVRNDAGVGYPNQHCPDQSVCEKSETCCEVISGGYACCPLVEATCCADKLHCCPHGYRCADGKCEKTQATQRHPLLSLLPTSHHNALEAVRNPEEPENVNQIKADVGYPNQHCPDQSVCEMAETCCEAVSGGYACCSLVEATCCDDKIHCCPNGYRCTDDGCEEEHGSLRHPLLALRSRASQAESETEQKEREIVEFTPLGAVAEGYPNQHCPDQSVCSMSSTCCEVGSGKYSCCPLVEATCCGDMTTCCPHGYWCAEDGCERVTSSNNNYILPPFLQGLFTRSKDGQDKPADPRVILL